MKFFGAFETAFDRDKTLKQAEKYLQQGKIEAAIKEYDKVFQAEPTDMVVANTLGDLHLRANRPAEALAKFTLVADHYRRNNHLHQAVAVYKKIVKLAPDDSDLGLTLADLYRKQEMTADARQQYLAVFTAAKRSGRTGTAARAFKEAVKLDPDNTALKLDYAEFQRSAGNPAEAAEAFCQAGQDHLRAGRIVESTQTFHEALVVKSDSLAALKGLVDVGAKVGDLKPVLRQIEERLARSPGNADLLVLLGRAHLAAKDFALAEATFTQIVAADPNRFEYLLEVSRGLVADRHFDQAMTLVDRCRDTLLAKGQKKKATAILKEIVRLDPENLPALKRLAAIYHHVGEKRNLSSTLNLIVQVTLRKGLEQEAYWALHHLVAIQPKKKEYQKQLADLAPKVETTAFPEGFEAPSAVGYYDRMRTDAPAAAQAEPTVEEVIEEIAETEYSTALLDEMVQQSPELLLARISLMEKMIARQPDHIDSRVQLKNLYLDAKMAPNAARECLELARLYEAKGEAAKAEDIRAEARKLDPGAGMVLPTLVPTLAASSVSLSPFSPTSSSGIASLLNLAQFQKIIEREWQHAARAALPVSVLRFKIDDFAAVVAMHRDTCLNEVAAALDANLERGSDQLAYCGDDEFIILLSGIGGAEAAAYADRLRLCVQAKNLPHPGSRVAPVVTVSAGVAEAHPNRAGSTPVQLATAVNQAMYQARAEGGNRVVTG